MPSKHDAAAFAEVAKHTGETILRFPFLSRWFFHIGHFDAETRAKFALSDPLLLVNHSINSF